MTAAHQLAKSTTPIEQNQIFVALDQKLRACDKHQKYMT